ncbi:ribonuclease E activity regulator RraA [Budviciaceae bacterium BWR-B9]|uniref:4-hydroxy-4-methyl-2-oxoglutarate aldolase n=1 Tax=Limnobaculum allomyrinae TaxID=2791986 RepID=A0ABS1IV82_9GAMM|nr:MULTISPECIES: ribonuclease E activity regulator RraA [Limnobaculum]MBK5145441.1 ribonuclease E activity regulator RraA [Limnobaculum allomyrinae]MBV7693131.1 ribonuclease E activity regulator RraA [Limnobaculum sp. M2-1]
MGNQHNVTKVADLCDACSDRVRVFAPLFTDFGGKTEFHGPVATVKCFEDNSLVKSLSLTPGNGRIMVVDGGGSARCALLGDNLATNLINNGWQGAIIYGYIRDKAELAQMSIGIKALGAIPLRSARKSEGTIGEPVEFAGQVIQEGDYIYADDDGIIILNPV